MGTSAARRTRSVDDRRSSRGRSFHGCPMSGTVAVVAFVIGFFGSMPMAGPVAVMTVARAAEKAFGAAARLAVGSAVAEAIFAGVSYWGFAHFFGRHPAIVPASNALTAIVLGALGAKFTRYRLPREARTMPRFEERLLGHAGPVVL